MAANEFAGELVVLADRWFDGTRLRAEPVSIRVRGDRIVAIETRGSDVASHAPSGSVIDARGALVTPGLVNVHVHIARAGFFEPTEPIGVRQMLRNFAGALAAGVTTVGDMGCPPKVIAALRAHVASHPLAGPSIRAAGPLVTAPHGYPLDWVPPLFVRFGVALTCTTEAEGARAAARVAGEGMDHVKLSIMHTSYADRPLEALSVEAARGAVREAHRLGLRAFAHAHSVADYRVALAAGVDALMHSSFEPLDDALVRQIRDLGIPVCPTLWVFESACLASELAWHRDPDRTRYVIEPVRRSWERFAEAWHASGDVVPRGIAGGASKERARAAVQIAAANLRLLIDAGVPIAFGNDAAYGLSVIARPVDELSAMQRAGLDALGCLRAATRSAAELLGCSDRGAIAEGARADLLVTDVGATEDIAAIENVRMVIAAGRIVERPPALARARLVTAWLGGAGRMILGTLPHGGIAAGP